MFMFAELCLHRSRFAEKAVPAPATLLSGLVEHVTEPIMYRYRAHAIQFTLSTVDARLPFRYRRKRQAYEERELGFTYV